MSEKELINLKEAAKISGYSADYIGQLIRSGKIPGKQVYSNISWMTTADAVVQYKNTSKAKQANPGVGTKIGIAKRKLEIELGIIKLVFKNFKSAIPLTIIVLVLFSLLVYSVFYFSSNRKSQNNPTEKETTNQELIF